MKAICTRRNPDGSFDEVGMRNRCVLIAKSTAALEVKARRLGLAPCRLEIWNCDANLYREPDRVLILKPAYAGV